MLDTNILHVRSSTFILIWSLLETNIFRNSIAEYLGIHVSSIWMTNNHFVKSIVKFLKKYDNIGLQHPNNKFQKNNSERRPIMKNLYNTNYTRLKILNFFQGAQLYLLKLYLNSKGGVHRDQYIFRLPAEMWGDTGALGSYLKLISNTMYIHIPLD